MNEHKQLSVLVDELGQLAREFGRNDPRVVLLGDRIARMTGFEHHAKQRVNEAYLALHSGGESV
jgi:2-iminoacetate synthase ThiH